MRLRQRKQDGFTIIELVITIAISTILLGAMFGLFEWHQKVYLREAASVMATSAVRQTMQNITKNIAQATNIEASHSFGGTTYTTSGSTIVLKLPSVDATDNIIASTYDYVAVYLHNGAVYQLIEPGSGSVRLAGTRQLADNVTTFALTYNNGVPASASEATLDIQVSVSTRNGNLSTRVIDTVFLRNQ